ncbi:MAG: DUF4399 domain-containing protein [Steroidobacteraceae bacterium]
MNATTARNACWMAMIVVAISTAGCQRGAQSPAPAEPANAAPPTAPVALPRTPAPSGASVFIIEPVDGATVTNPVTVRFGAEGVAIVKAGDTAPNSGHHHLLIDTGLPDLSQPIPNDEQHRHFGGGQTETQIELAPGEHSLTLLLGDYLHIPHDPPVVSETIHITVR